MNKKSVKNIFIKNITLFLLIFSFTFFAYNVTSNNFSINLNNQNIKLAGNVCGGTGSSQVTTSIDFGCKGQGNGIIDLVFAIIRFLSDGVGIVVIASIIYAGIQYIISAGDPQKINSAINRIRSSIIALIVFIFAYAILNYLIPGAFLNK